MGQGTSKYRKITRTPQTGENAGKKLWYATAVSDREMSFEDFVTHISEHNSPYSRGTIHGVLMDTLDCLKHLILDGKSVRFSDLGLFSIGMTSRGEVSKEKVTAASVLGVHLIVRNTKTWSNAELKKLTKIVAYDDYTSGAENDGGGTENTPSGGGTSQGAGGETNKDNGGTSQGGGGTSQGTGGGTDSGTDGGGDNVNF
uniref:HU family DNA-binding protein n=1 Tax=Segatella copri TaxID=165179 RepID=UPI003FEFFB7C